MVVDSKERVGIDFRYTKVFNETLDAYLDGYLRCLHQGGTSSSKTYSILQFLERLATKSTVPLRISVVSESLPHLKRGAITDFFNIVGEVANKSNPNWSSTAYSYRRPEWHENVFIEFFGADDAGKVHGPRRDILFINEGNNLAWKTVDQLDTRTRLFTIVDWNPVSEFWAHEYESGDDVLPGWIHDTKNNKLIKSTYLDAKDVLPDAVVEKIESHRNDPNWWRIYGEGETGNIEGLVYPNWDNDKQIIDKLPDGDYFYGLDFGYTDPTVLVKNVIIGSNLYSEEVLWGINWGNDVLAREMELAGVRKHIDLITADCEDAKSIAFLQERGYLVRPSEKGKDSERYGHLKVNEYLQHWTKNSLNCIKEQRNFRYITRLSNGREWITNETTHFFSHGMSARRYGVETYEPPWSGPELAPVNY